MANDYNTAWHRKCSSGLSLFQLFDSIGFSSGVAHEQRTLKCTPKLFYISLKRPASAAIRPCVTIGFKYKHINVMSSSAFGAKIYLLKKYDTQDMLLKMTTNWCFWYINRMYLIANSSRQSEHAFLMRQYMKIRYSMAFNWTIALGHPTHGNSVVQLERDLGSTLSDFSCDVFNQTETLFGQHCCNLYLKKDESHNWNNTSKENQG